MSEMRRCRAQCAGNDAEVDTDLPGIIRVNAGNMGIVS